MDPTPNIVSIPEEISGLPTPPTNLTMDHSHFVRCSDSSGKKMLMAQSYSDLDSLPDDAVNEILIRIPIQDILKSTMVVCRKWYEMTHTRKFSFAHFHHSTPGLLIKNMNNKKAYFMSINRSGEIEISKLRYNFTNRIWSSCNGLVLELKPTDRYELIITNPLTKQHFATPPFFAGTLYANSKSTMAYVASQMDYKVVRTYYLGVPSPKSHAQCAILTVGVDESWRHVDTQHLSLEASQLLNMCPLVTGGVFVHYAEDWHSNIVLQTTRIITEKSNQFVLTLNMETEMITHISAPQCNGGYYYYKYLSGGSCLSLLIGRGYLKWEVWEMKPETGEWTKLPDIDLEAHKVLLNETYDAEEFLKPEDGASLDCKLFPAGWLKYPDVIVFVTIRPMNEGDFRQARLRVVYNVQTQDISLFVLNYNCHPYIPHRHSLMRI